MKENISTIFYHLAYYENNILPHLECYNNDSKGFYKSPLFTIRDTSLAIYNFIELGMLGNSDRPNIESCSNYRVGEQYLRIQGVLNAAYIQQESIKHIAQNNNLIDEFAYNNILGDIDKLPIITLRHKIASHNNKYLNKNNNKKTYDPYTIEQFTLAGHYLTLKNNRLIDERQRINLKELLQEYIGFICTCLAEMNKESMGNIQPAGETTVYIEPDTLPFLYEYQEHYYQNKDNLDNAPTSNNDMQYLFKYIKFYRDYIASIPLNRKDDSKDGASKDVLGDIQGQLKLNKKEDWSFITSSLDTITDTCLSIDNFILLGYIGNRDNVDHFCNIGEKYLRLYGALNAFYIQAEAICTLSHRNNLNNPSQIKSDMKLQEIIEARHKIAAHNSNYNNDLKSYNILPKSLKDYIVGITCNMEESTYHEVCIYDLVIIYLNFTKDVLYNICDKAINTIYRSNQEKLDELISELNDIKDNKEKDIYIYTDEDKKIIEERFYALWDKITNNTID